MKEAGRVYRRMKDGKMEHEQGRSLVWVLAQIKAMLEAQHLERIEGRLNELAAAAQGRGGLIGHGDSGADRETRLPN
jgi:hypothetical protein